MLASSQSRPATIATKPQGPLQIHCQQTIGNQNQDHLLLPLHLPAACVALRKLRQWSCPALIALANCWSPAPGPASTSWSPQSWMPEAGSWPDRLTIVLLGCFWVLPSTEDCRPFRSPATDCNQFWSQNGPNLRKTWHLGHLLAVCPCLTRNRAALARSSQRNKPGPWTKIGDPRIPTASRRDSRLVQKLRTSGTYESFHVPPPRSLRSSRMP